MQQPLYKILEGGQSCHGGTMSWSLPGKRGGRWMLGAWQEVAGELAMGTRGLHLTTEPFRWYTWNCACYLAEAEGIAAWRDDECVARRVRLLEEVPHPTWWRRVHAFVEDELATIPWLRSDGAPLSHWRVFACRRDAQQAAREAGWRPLDDPFRQPDLRPNQPHFYDGLVVADAVWEGMTDAMKEPSHSCPFWDASWDMGTYIHALTPYGAPKWPLSEAQRNVQVWRKGYGHYGTVDGTMYVYERP